MDFNRKPRLQIVFNKSVYCLRRGNSGCEVEKLVKTYQSCVKYKNWSLNNTLGNQSYLNSPNLFVRSYFGLQIEFMKTVSFLDLSKIEDKVFNSVQGVGTKGVIKILFIKIQSYLYFSFSECVRKLVELPVPPCRDSYSLVSSTQFPFLTLFSL